MSKTKVTYNDIADYGQEVNRKYKLTQGELERQLRRHLDGANATERRMMYEKFYRKRK